MDKELEKKYNLLTNILYINMWGDAQRNNNTIYINRIIPGVPESDICVRIASIVARTHNVKVAFKCGFFEYLKVLKEYKYLFKKDNPFIRVKEKDMDPNARYFNTWLFDVSDAQGAPREIWRDIWKYLNEDSNE